MEGHLLACESTAFSYFLLIVSVSLSCSPLADAQSLPSSDLLLKDFGLSEANHLADCHAVLLSST